MGGRVDVAVSRRIETALDDIPNEFNLKAMNSKYADIDDDFDDDYDEGKCKGKTASVRRPVSVRARLQ